MNLSTHFVAGFALGIGLFHNDVLALIIAIGALLPDLDREYFYAARGFMGKSRHIVRCFITLCWQRCCIS